MKKDKDRTGTVDKNKFDESAKKYFCPQIHRDTRRLPCVSKKVIIEMSQYLHSYKKKSK